MTKQKEIENAIVNKQLFELKLVSPMIPKELEYNARQYAKELMKKLSELGCVIKVDEIKEMTTTASESERFYAQGKGIVLVSTERTAHIFKAFKEAGYSAWEPLINDNDRKVGDNVSA